MAEQSHRKFLEWLRAEFVAGRIKARPMESFAHKGVLTDSAGNLVTMQELQDIYDELRFDGLYEPSTADNE